MKVTARELAQMTGGVLEGDAKALIYGFAKIEDAKEGDLSFIANPKYSQYAPTTAASVLLVGKDFETPEGLKATLVKVDDPYSTLAHLMRLWEQGKMQPTGIESPVAVGENTILPDDIYLGSFSYLGRNIKIGHGVKIYPQVYIGDNCEIEENTVIYAGVKIYSGCKIGKRCVVHSGAVIGADGFGFAPVEGHYEKIPQIGGVILEDDVEIGANTTIDRATFGNTIIGKGTKLDNLIQIAHNVKVGRDNVFAAQTGVAGSTQIGDRNRFGGQCGFAGHITVGNDNEIGAQSGIPNNIGDNKRLIGYPAIDARLFAKNVVYMKKLGELFKKK